MNDTRFGIILAYLFTIPLAVCIDLSWAGFVMKDFYRSELGYVLSTEVQFVPLIFFYLLLSFGIFVLAAYPAYRAQSILRAALSGFLLGLVAYGTYDLTNMATLSNWPLILTEVDILWGGVVCSLTAVAGFLFLRRLDK